MTAPKRKTGEGTNRVSLNEFARRYGATLTQDVTTRHFKLELGDKWVFVLDKDTSLPVRNYKTYDRQTWETIILHNLFRLVNQVGNE